GDRLATYRERGTQVQLWDLRRGLPVRNLDHPADVYGVYSVAWHPDGRFLAVGSGLRIFIWDTASGVQRGILSGLQSEVIWIAFHREGDILVSRSHDDMTRLWDPWRSRQLAAGTLHLLPLRNGADAGDTVTVQGAQTGLVRLANRRECRTLSAHEGVGKGP